MLNLKALATRALSNPTFKDGSNGCRVQRLELPSINGIGQVQDIAKVYIEFATGGHALDIEETLTTLSKPTMAPKMAHCGRAE